MSEAKENLRCEIHHYLMSDGRCSCPHECDNCGVTYVGGHSKYDCITVLKNRLRLNELSATITTLSAGRDSMSNEELVAAARADLLANLHPVTAVPELKQADDDECGSPSCWFNSETGYREYCPKHEAIIADEAMETDARRKTAAAISSAAATDSDFVHEDDCPCFGDETPHSIDCANCTCDKSCKMPPEGWVCSRQFGHDGPCAARPRKLYQTVSKLEAGLR